MEHREHADANNRYAFRITMVFSAPQRLCGEKIYSIRKKLIQKLIQG